MFLSISVMTSHNWNNPTMVNRTVHKQTVVHPYRTSHRIRIKLPSNTHTTHTDLKTTTPRKRNARLKNINSAQLYLYECKSRQNSAEKQVVRVGALAGGQGLNSVGQGALWVVVTLV